jgi:hypothetical protein
MALIEPWIVTKTFRKLPEGTRVFDYGFAENSRNLVDPETGQILMLGPDGEPLNP